MNRSSPKPPAADSTGSSRPWLGNAFGLSLEADLPVIGLEQREGPGEPPLTTLRETTPEAIDLQWVPGETERKVDNRYPDGRVMMTVDEHPEKGYRIDAPGYGRFRVTIDGSLIECAPAEGPAWLWHRALFAQALPLAAALNGIEVIHASGVVIDGRGLAFVGHSGAGKTSLAIQLVDQGAKLLADDVVAISKIHGQLHAHPGARFSNVAQEQFDSVASGHPERLGGVLGRSDKLHIQVGPMAEAAVPLGALYYIERGETIPELRFERLSPPDPTLLLASTFVQYAPAQMPTRLEALSEIAERVSTFRLLVPRGHAASELAPLVAAHSRETVQDGRLSEHPTG
jgi:hypothetical protein